MNEHRAKQQWSYLSWHPILYWTVLGQSLETGQIQLDLGSLFSFLSEQDFSWHFIFFLVKCTVNTPWQPRYICYIMNLLKLLSFKIFHHASCCFMCSLSTYKGGCVRIQRVMRICTPNQYCNLKMLKAVHRQQCPALKITYTGCLDWMGFK